jgi:putative oxidoreductase
MRRLLYSHSVGYVGSLGLLVLRVVVGAAFMFHGWPKIQNPTDWLAGMGESAPPGVMQALAAVAEFGGGAALIIGFLTRLASLGLGGTMVGALALAHLPAGDPFVASAPGQASFELAAVYLACSILFFILGPGRFSLDAALFGAPRTV